MSAAVTLSGIKFGMALKVKHALAREAKPTNRIAQQDTGRQ